MNHRALPLLLALVLVALGAGTAMAGDIVTVPTANQVKAGEIDVADYYIFVDQDALIDPLQPLGIDFVRVQTFYMGLTDKVEVDVHRYDVDVAGVNTIFNATYLVLEEDAQRPNVVLGGRDLSNEYGHASYFVSAAKTLNPPVAGPPTEPIIRLHLSLGTEDNTLFGEGRHEGLFGGVQILLRPSNPAVGLVALYDGQDIITGLTCVPKPGWPTLKGGTFGGHWWVGASYTFNAK
ncbi:MAG: hypothetical protein MUQ65_04770 [Armatimonadetes bacterium]|nr:hypothetical protein [Armatimonadota bacterium]